ncbi:hypothetical protein A4X09_0g3575 [Tilletia walkeri]|uniref:Uncharacterized protein n=1 Tax=Tilletia walkeri TaxID=117179 RepID=A0A8X7N9C0_9BASI|nr:hypothetical protein A4X09_0g3575 [Tilletia walkeri]
MSAYQVPEVDASSLFDNFTCRVGHNLVQQWSYRRDADPFTFSYQVQFQKKRQTLDVDNDDDQGSSSSDEDYEQSKSVIFTDLKFVQDFSGKNEIGFEQGYHWIRLAFPESYLLNLHNSLTSTHPNFDLTPDLHQSLGSISLKGKTGERYLTCCIPLLKWNLYKNLDFVGINGVDVSQSLRAGQTDLTRLFERTGRRELDVSAEVVVSVIYGGPELERSQFGDAPLHYTFEVSSLDISAPELGIVRG